MFLESRESRQTGIDWLMEVLRLMRGWFIGCGRSEPSRFKGLPFYPTIPPTKKEF